MAVAMKTPDGTFLAPEKTDDGFRFNWALAPGRGSGLP